jgi:pantoate--beta-alanine ligase
MKWIRTVADLRETLSSRGAGTVGFVPTMGALHAGHVRLFEVARRECTVLVASIFVNPTQFNDAADLAAYPRVEARDGELAAAAGVDVLFLPPVAEVYPESHATSVVVKGVALGFEGDHRPGHFDGVATVCLKLFSMVRPDRAYFGQKDAQQVAVIRQMVADLNLAIDIRVVATERDPDGLALSSRNARLSGAERIKALAISRALRAGVEAHHAGRDPVEAARAQLSGLDVEYVAVAPFLAAPTLVIAARVGTTRLIDNVPLHDPQAAGLRFQRDVPTGSS